MKLLRDLDVSGKRVFLRGDLDVPLESLGAVNGEREGVKDALLEDIRLTRIKPTFDYIRSQGAAKIIVAGKIGRAKGNREPSLSTKRIKSALEDILGTEMAFADDLENLPDAPVVLLENLHFWSEELEPNEDFAKKIASLADVFVNENFASAHRNEASIIYLPTLLPHAAGLHFAEEVRVLSDVLKSPKRPFVAVVGGAKIETKLPVIESLAKVADKVLVGGKIAGEVTREMNFGDNVTVAKLTDDGMEITEDSASAFIDEIKGAKTVVWNGPMGKFEDGYIVGTRQIAQAILDCVEFSVVGGGQTVQFLEIEDLLSPPAGGFSFVSSGGGAMLEFLAGKELPAVKALG